MLREQVRDWAVLATVTRLGASPEEAAAATYELPPARLPYPDEPYAFEYGRGRRAYLGSRILLFRDDDDPDPQATIGRLADRVREESGAIPAKVEVYLVDDERDEGTIRIDRAADVTGTELFSRAVVRADQVQLLRAELQLAAGSFEEAHRTLDGIPPQSTAVDRGRVALVRVRAALASGQLARADRELGTLAAVPAGEPMLFASATSARVAVEAELNQLEIAMRIATEAKAALVAGRAPGAALELVERATRETAGRGRSVFAWWELPYVVGAGAPAMPLPPASEPAGSRWRLTPAWTAAANAVLFALERGDHGAAAAEQARLEDLARGIESEYVASRVALSGTMVGYYVGAGDASQLLVIAARFQALGARTAEAQAVRFAG